MRRNILNSIILTILVLIIGNSCSDGETSQSESVLNVTPETLTFEEMGGTAIITVKATSDWYLQTDKEVEWFRCSLDEQNKHTVQVTVETNKTTEERTAQVTFHSGTLKKTVLITQQAGEKPAEEKWKLQTSMNAEASLAESEWEVINNYMKQFKFEYSEHPNNAESNDHLDGVHIEVVKDETLGYDVFKFNIHASADEEGNILILDGDRGERKDRQRNEMKTRTKDTDYRVNGNWEEEQKLEWKFKIPTGFRPTKNFTHIHQLKAQEGNNGSPVITISLRASDTNGKNSRVQVIHNGDVSATNKGTIIDNLPLSDFEDEWIQVTTQMRYTHDGFFSIKMERMSDHKVLVEKSFEHIDMWRKGAKNIRSKYGIYRSYGGKLTEGPEGKFPTSGIKDESLYLADFKIYEQNTNPNPEVHD